jgi:hypothetical protein
MKNRGGGRNRYIADAALDLLIELESTRLEVVLIPSEDDDCAMRGGKIRKAHLKNPAWYSEFCQGYTARRRKACRYHRRRCTCPKEEKAKRKWFTRERRKSKLHDTCIKRAHTIAALERVIAGKLESTYVDRLWPFILERAQTLRKERSCDARQAKESYSFV